jgi:predicted RNA binding protein YcfA (HicA-like mRNA interferase family)
MSKLYSSREIVAVLQKLGFLQTSQKGSHAKFKNSSGNIAIVPMAKKEIPEGTFRSILKQADITLSIFKDNL